ncbi:hypothetical protein IFM89_021309 [Coptis chinensis]|uniref:Uncharacterized protein n=1 Tax=Coptis chinensis TaxID=261450 RepID=A0A835HZ21_9MAGN|nr:hypothetical protein IFM89_021309 [Coptis chinensis]
MASSGTTTKAQLLLEAASNGNLRRLKNLAAELDVGKGIAATVASIKNSKGESALHLAAAEGNTDICKYLINDLKLDVDIKDNKGP